MKCKDCNGIGKWDYGTGLDDVETCKTCNGTGQCVRPSVSWFAEQMEETLKQNDHKGGWGPENCSMNYLNERLEEEVRELTYVVGCSGPGIKERIISECTDVANFAMMIADRIRQME